MSTPSPATTDIAFKITLKRNQGTEVRRFRSESTLSLDAARTIVRQWWTAHSNHLVWQYTDSDGDIVTLSTEAEWAECISHHMRVGLAKSCGECVVRVTISKRTVSHSVNIGGAAAESQKPCPEIATDVVESDARSCEVGDMTADAVLQDKKALREFSEAARREFREMRRELREARRGLRRDTKSSSAPNIPPSVASKIEGEQSSPAPSSNDETCVPHDEVHTAPVLPEAPATTTPHPVLSFSVAGDADALSLVFGPEHVEALTRGGEVAEGMRGLLSITDDTIHVDSQKLAVLCSTLGYKALDSSPSDAARAVALYVHATRLNPRDYISLYNYACALCQSGHMDEALTALSQAVTLGYRNVEHMVRDPDLALLRGTPVFHGIVADLTGGRTHWRSSQNPSEATDMFPAEVPVNLPESKATSPAPMATASQNTPQPNVATLLAVFPGMEESVAVDVLAAARGDVRRAVEMLLR